MSLLAAVEDGDVKKVKELLNDPKMNVDVVGFWKITPLMSACSRGNMEIVNLLLTHKANAHAIDRTGTAVLYYAVASSMPNEHIIRTLIQQGCPVNQFNREHRSPLDFSVAANNKNICEMLLDMGGQGGTSSHSVYWFKEILRKRTRMKETSLIYLALARRTRVCCKDVRSIIASLLWASRNDNKWLLF